MFYAIFILIHLTAPITPFLVQNDISVTDSTNGNEIDTSPQDSIKNMRNYAPRVFLDCKYCDKKYIKTEITFINYVRECKEAQIHILVTRESTGSGGTKYTISFIGQKDFADLNYTIEYVTKSTATADEIRKGLTHTFKMGLMPYIARSPLANYISILFQQVTKPTLVKDRWNNWVFNIGLSGYLNGEEQSKSISLYGNLSASRITLDSKIRLRAYGNYYENRFTISDKIIASTSRGQGFSSLYVLSLNNHWSAGGRCYINSSTFRNEELLVSVAPTIEYNIFPYSESTKRRLLCRYQIAVNYNDYFEETIYDKTSEQLFSEMLSISHSTTQTWGSIYTSLIGSHYFHDFSKNNLSFYTSLSLRLLKGFSLTLGGNVSIIHDQLSLPKGGATEEEILLSRKQLATQYRYYGRIGINYTFGSIYSNVVNPRFGY